MKLLPRRFSRSGILLAGVVLPCLSACDPAQAGPDSVVTINEIDFHPAEPAGAEWIELHNQMAIRVDISAWTLRGGVTFAFPEGTVLEPGAFLVVSSLAGTPAGALGPFEGRLDNAGEEVRLHERHGRMMDAVDYGDGDRWPHQADGGGFTLAKRGPEMASGQAESWRASAGPGGTPGSANFPAAADPGQRPVFAAGGSWKVLAAGADAIGGWNGASFPDGNWPTAASPFTTNGSPSLLLRKTFAWLGDTRDLQLVFDGSAAAGATVHFYVNGVAAGSPRQSGGDGTLAVLLAGDAVVTGANVLALSVTAPAGATEVAIDGGLTGITGLLLPEAREPATGPIVINEIHYHPRPVYADQDIPYQAQHGAEWIELLNISSETIALEGWSVGGGIRHDFPEGQMLAPGGFLVLTDAEFSGGLSNRGERIVLRDAAGGLVDVVHYQDSGRWPEAADGGGSSLELVDPRADNTAAEAWAASDETARTTWHDYRYRATGTEPPGTANPSTWREFLMGFLDAGEALIDDISVVEDPDGAALELITNGGFDGDAPGSPPSDWRLLGTHKLGRVVADPESGGNVLHLVATGEQTHTYNTASITLANNRAINRSREYEIRFRAKWLTGSPQLNTRLYLNRAARTHILAQPAGAGTPGAPNSRLAAAGNAGPTFHGVRHFPAVPEAGEPVFVVAAASDTDGVQSVNLMFRADGGDWQETAMAAGREGAHVAILPGRNDREVVQFYLEARDAAGAEATFPGAGAESRALYRVGDDRVSEQSARNSLRLVMLDAESDAMYERVHAVSNHRWGGTVIYNDREVYYDVGVRLRSAPYGRQGRPGWNIRFGDANPFRGVHGTAVIDGALNVPRGDGTGWVTTTAGASINEMLYNVVAKRAGGIAATYDDIVYFAGPRRADNRHAQLKMMRFENAYLEELMPDGADGNLYKQELIYYPTTTVNGQPDGLKNPYNMVSQVDIRNLGPDKNAYRFNYLLRNNRDRDDFSPIIRMCESFSSTATLRSDAINEVIDVDNWMRTLALNALLGVADTYNNGLAHNLMFYSRPDDGRVMIFPWDLDHAFYYAPEASIFGQGTHRVSTLIDQSRNRRIFRGHLLDLCSVAFSSEWLDPWVDHLHAVADQNYATRFKRWISERRAHVLAQVEAGSPRVEFAIDDDLPPASSEVFYTLKGRGWVDVHGMRLVRDGSSAPLAVNWLNGQDWEALVPLSAGTNVLKVEAVNYSGELVGADAITVTRSGGILPATSGSLLLSELMYHPAPPTDAETAAGFEDAELFEFVEVASVSTSEIDLEGCRFVDGIAFTFPPLRLDPGQRVVVVRNATAFLTRYGGAARIAGVFTGSLANGGERARLVERAGFVIDEVDYNDRLPWPTEADGEGFSLTRVGGVLEINAGPEGWRPSARAGGSPGTDDTERRNDGTSLVDYAFGSGGPSLSALREHAGGTTVLQWVQRTAADEATVVVEFSSNLVEWAQADGMELQLRQAGSDGEGSRHFTAELEHAEARAGHVRLRVQPR